MRTAREHVPRALAGETFSVGLRLEGRPFELRLKPLLEANGEPAGAVSVLTEIEDAESLRRELAQRVAFEQIVTDLSSQLTALPTDGIDEGIHSALERIGQFADVDRAYVFCFSSDDTTMVNTHEWCAPGIEPQIDNLQALPISVFPWWIEHLRQHEIIHVPRVSELPEGAAAEREILVEQSIVSVIVTPLVHNGSLMGFMGFDAVRAEKSWPDDDIVLLRMVGEMIAGALERKRTRDLEAQLLEARNLENVARLAGGIAHDFNNLLSIVLSSTGILRRKVADPMAIEVVDRIHDASSRAAELTRQLLQVGRRGITEPMVLDVNAVVTGLSRLLEGKLGEQIELSLELQEDLSPVRIGLPQLEQVIVNLAVNAQEAMPHGGRLAVRTADVTLGRSHADQFVDVTAGPYVMLQMTDTGSGMPADLAVRAFEPFFTTKGTGGTGLGLATVYGIVKQAGGHATLSSTLGEGTIVTVYLPSLEGIAASPIEPEDRKTPPPAGHGETVLVVEDSPSLRSLVCALLAENHYRVLDAGAPSEALEVCSRDAGTVDILLTDVILPEMSGRDLARQAEREHGISRVLYMSGYDRDRVADQGSIPPGTRMLYKPFLEEDLLREIRRVLDEG